MEKNPITELIKVRKEEETLTLDQECNLFRAVIMCYNVNASYGERAIMSIDRPFTDFFGVFGEENVIYNQKDIAPYWKKVTRGEWKCPKDNAFVLAIMASVDWDRI